MSKRDPETVRKEVALLIENFEEELRSGELRTKVLTLVPIFLELRNLGKALIPDEHASASRARILYYFLQYPRTVINSEELFVVAGVQEYARRLRELRVNFGWSIASGITVREMGEGEGGEWPEEYKAMKPMTMSC